MEAKQPTDREGHTSLDYYQILQVEPSASYEEIKQSYHKLALLHHPDRAEASHLFHAINEAWQTLSREETRAVYDASRKERQVGEHPVTAEIDLDEMHYDDTTSTYSFQCRCGGQYRINEEQMTRGIEFVVCGGCSFAIRVLYGSLSEEEG
jgi:diphthamide biosynthesis protein 4